VYLKKSQKWSLYGVALSMALTERRFEEVYKKPQRCGHEVQRGLKKKRMKDIANTYKTLIDGVVIIMPFPTVGGTSRGSSWLRSYALFKMKPRSMVKKPWI
jgi:hypothetical protein